MVRAGERHEHVPRASLATDEHRDVAGSVVEQAQEPRVLEEAGGGVDEEKLGVLLTSEPRQIRSRGRAT